MNDAVSEPALVEEFELCADGVVLALDTVSRVRENALPEDHRLVHSPAGIVISR